MAKPEVATRAACAHSHKVGIRPMGMLQNGQKRPVDDLGQP